MSEGTLKNLIALLGALVLIYALVALTRGLGGDDSGDTALARALGDVAGESIEAVRIRRSGDTITLRRADGGWTVNGFAVESTTSADFWAAVESAADAEVVSTNPENHARMGVTAEGATIVGFLRDGEPAARIFVGDAGPYSPSAYVRLAGNDRVAVAQGDLRRLVRQAVDDWRDKSIARVDTAAVRRVAVEREDDAYTLERGEDGWTVDGEPATQRTVRDLLGALAMLDADGFAPDTATFEPTRTVTAFGAGGDTLTVARLRPGEEAGDRTRLSVPGDATIYELAAWRADRLTPDPADVRAERAEPAGT